MRGISTSGRASGRTARIIPAGAGHLRTKRSSRRASPDHPRRCGAFPRHVTPRLPARGSSPQVRGILALLCSCIATLGIIPAGAGHFSWGSFSSSSSSDHPRRCGAFHILFFLLWFGLGSSPQVRGISTISVKNSDLSGIIPAGAGHFPGLSGAVFSSGDHPRRCGAFLPISLNNSRALGSSPQVRGIYSLSWNIDPKYSFLTPSYR